MGNFRFRFLVHMTRKSSESTSQHVHVSEAPSETGILGHGRRKRKMVRKFGSKRSGACVTISTTRDKSGPKHLIYWYEPGIKARQTEGTRDEVYAETRAKEIHEMLKNGVVEVGRIDHKTLVLVREAEEILGGSGVSVAQAARRFMAMLDQSPADLTPEKIFAQGMLSVKHPVKHKWNIEECKARMFREYRVVLKREETTLSGYAQTFKALAKVHGDRPMAEITKSTLQQVVGRYVGMASYEPEIGRVRTIMEWCRTNECYPANGTLPSHEIPLPPKMRSSDAPKIFSVKACLKQVRLAPERAFPTQVLLSFNLFRPCEAYRMTFEQLFAFWDIGWIWMPDNVAKKIHGRYAARWTPIFPVTRFLLEKYRGRKGYIFPGNKKYRPLYFLNYLSRFRKQIHVTNVSDGLRKSCISMFAALGTDMYKLSKWAGNTPATIRRHYDDPATTESFIRVLTAGLLGCKLTDPAVDASLKKIMDTSTTPKEKPVKLNFVPHRRYVSNLYPNRHKG